MVQNSAQDASTSHSNSKIHEKPCPQDPKILPKRCRVVRFYTSVVFLKIAPKTTKNAQDGSPNRFKLAILAPTWSILAASWLQLGPILAHLGEIFDDPSPAKIDQNRLRQIFREFWCQGRSQDLPDPLQTSIFQVLGPIFGNFSSIF